MIICHPLLDQAGSSGKAKGEAFIKYSVASSLKTLCWHSEIFLICNSGDVTFLTL